MNSVSHWPNLRHLAELLGGAVKLIIDNMMQLDEREQIWRWSIWLCHVGVGSVSAPVGCRIRCYLACQEQVTTEWRQRIVSVGNWVTTTDAHVHTADANATVESRQHHWCELGIRDDGRQFG